MQLVEAVHQREDGARAGGEVDAREDLDAALELRDVVLVEPVGDERPPAGAAAHPPARGVLDHEAEAGDVIVGSMSSTKRGPISVNDAAARSSGAKAPSNRMPSSWNSSMA